MGRPTNHPELTPLEREELIRLTNRSRSARSLAFRGRIILRSADGLSDSDIVRELRCNKDTVGKWRKRFLMHRLDGLYDEPRPGVERKISDDQVEAIVVKTLETTPKGA